MEVGIPSVQNGIIVRIVNRFWCDKELMMISHFFQNRKFFGYLPGKFNKDNNIYNYFETHFFWRSHITINNFADNKKYPIYQLATKTI